jgi:hypothetical protein
MDEALSTKTQEEQTMSKGHGKWECAILEALNEIPAFYLTDLLPIRHTRSHVVALNRARSQFVRCGQDQHVQLVVQSWAASGDGYGEGEQPYGFVTIYRPGDPMPDRQQISRLKRCTGLLKSPMQHLNNSGRSERVRRKMVR